MIMHSLQVLWSYSNWVSGFKNCTLYVSGSNLYVICSDFVICPSLSHALQNTDKSRIMDSQMHGKSYKSRKEHARKYGFGSTLRNTDFLMFSSNQMNGYHQVNVSQKGQRDHGQMYIYRQLYEFFITELILYFFISRVGCTIKKFQNCVIFRSPTNK